MSTYGDYHTAWTQSPIKPVSEAITVSDNSLVANKVTNTAWKSSPLAGFPSVPDLTIDVMLHDLRYVKSEVAGDRGYSRGLSSGRVEGKGQSLFILFLDNSRLCAC